MYRKMFSKCSCAFGVCGIMIAYGRACVQSNCNVKVRDSKLFSSNPYQTTHIIRETHIVPTYINT